MVIEILKPYIYFIINGSIFPLAFLKISRVTMLMELLPKTFIRQYSNFWHFEWITTMT